MPDKLARLLAGCLSFAGAISPAFRDSGFMWRMCCMTDGDRAFGCMQAEEVQREDEAAADAYIAERTQDTAPACYVPHLAALAQQRDMPGAVRVRASNVQLCS